MRSAFISAAAAALICGAAPARAGEPPLSTEEQKTLYSLGRKIGQGLSAFEPSPRELAALQRGLADGVRDARPAVDPAAYPQAKVDALAAQRSDARAAREQARGKAFLEKAAREKGVIALENGLLFKELRAGTGAAPSASSRVRVHFRGTRVDGAEIDDTYARNTPAEFALGGHVIPCWTEGLLRMKAGGKARFVCPPSLAFGKKGRYPNVPSDATLVYEFELLDVETR